MPGEFSSSIIHVASAFHSRRAAAEQGGLLSGQDPTTVNTADPLRLWIVQLGIIVMMSQFLGFLLRRIRQPKVIAEVLGGILLGPTAFGRIPGFTHHIFPPQSLPFLSLVANMGLVLFLFLVGLEIETSVIKKNARFSLPIALGGMIIPFGLGAGISVPLYKHFVDQTTAFTHFMLFTCVAFSITAFPVLCRILTELKLIDTTVGVVVLSAGVGNDIIGWTLLALSVALVNAASGLSALYILLTAVAWVLFLLLLVKPLMLRFAESTGSIENGPSMLYMTITVLIAFGSAFFTDIIGVHAIFGGFLVGLVVPREGGLAIALMEKLEDMVSIIFLPLYFTLSGLSTNLGLLNNGTTWAFTVAICSLAYTGKFGGCTLAAKLSGFTWRESATVGSLMSCKGLVELIVLNVGLSAGILSQRVFSMFVFEALLLTFMTTPAVVALYPAHKRRKAPGATADLAASVMAPMEWEKIMPKRMSTVDGFDSWKTRFTIVLDKIEHLPGMMTLTQLIQPYSGSLEERSHESRKSKIESLDSDVKISEDPLNISIDALRLIELSDRTSAVMKSSVADQLIYTDPLLNVFKTFGDLNSIPISSSLSVVTFDDLAHRVAEHAKENMSHLILVPWLPPSVPLEGSGVAERDTPGTPLTPQTSFVNPFDMLFKTQHFDKSASVVHSQFIRAVFAQSRTDVALFVDRTSARANTSSGPIVHVRAGKRQNHQHLFLPFFGGPDDRLALDLVVQLCANPLHSATVVRITKAESEFESREGETATLERPGMVHTVSGLSGDEQEDVHGRGLLASLTIGSGTGNLDTVYANYTTATRLQSETADNLRWSLYSRSLPLPAPPSENLGSSTTNSGTIPYSRPQSYPEVHLHSEPHPRSPSPPLPPRQPHSHHAFPPAIQDALSRISFSEFATPEPLHAVIERTNALMEEQCKMKGEKPLIVVLGRSRRLAVEDHYKDLKRIGAEVAYRHGHGNGHSHVHGPEQSHEHENRHGHSQQGLGLGLGLGLGHGQSHGHGHGHGHQHGHGVVRSEVRKTIGDVATALVIAGCNAGLVVLQAANADLDDGVA